MVLSCFPLKGLTGNLFFFFLSTSLFPSPSSFISLVTFPCHPASAPDTSSAGVEAAAEKLFLHTAFFFLACGLTHRARAACLPREARSLNVSSADKALPFNSGSRNVFQAHKCSGILLLTFGLQEASNDDVGVITDQAFLRRGRSHLGRIALGPSAGSHEGRRRARGRQRAGKSSPLLLCSFLPRSAGGGAESQRGEEPGTQPLVISLSNRLKWIFLQINHWNVSQMPARNAPENNPSPTAAAFQAWTVPLTSSLGPSQQSLESRGGSWCRWPPAEPWERGPHPSTDSSRWVCAGQSGASRCTDACFHGDLGDGRAATAAPSCRAAFPAACVIFLFFIFFAVRLAVH